MLPLLAMMASLTCRKDLTDTGLRENLYSLSAGKLMALIKRQVLGSSAVEGGDQNPGEHTWENTLETAN